MFDFRKFSFLSCFVFVIFWGCSSGCNPASVSETGDITSAINTVSPIDWDDCGGKIGDHPCNFSFVDQNNDTWSLYDNYGTVILLDFSTMWCYYCKVSASHVEQIQSMYGSEFLWVTVLIENDAGATPALSDIQSWASTYGITNSPVLAGDRTIIDTTAENGYPITSWPTFVLIDTDMTISYGVHGWSKEIIVHQIEELINNTEE